MFTIINKQIIAENIKRIDVKAENIARRVLPGQFVVVMTDEKSSRIALPVVEADSIKGIISLVFEEQSLPTKRFGTMPIGESVHTILGPLGIPFEIEQAKKNGFVVCIGYGIGIAQILPLCRALRRSANKVIGIIGARTKKALLLENQMRLACDRVYITTDDGTHEQRGFVTGSFKEVLKDSKVRSVYCIGPIDIMKAVCSMTRKKKIKTWVSLNPVMIDGTGLCGSCRVKIEGKYVLACIEGPSFDGHRVDFDDLKTRSDCGKEQEECCNHKSQYRHLKNGPITLTKLWEGLRKS